MDGNDALVGQPLDLGLGELFARAVTLWPNRIAAAFPGERLTYSDLWAGALEVGQRLVDAGIQPGEHVGLLVPNSGNFLKTLLGISLYGGVPVPLNTRYRSDELPFVVEHADLVALITIGAVSVNLKGETVDYPARIAQAFPALALGGHFLSEAPRLRAVFGYGRSTQSWLAEWAEPAAAETAAESTDRESAEWIRPSAPGGTALLLYTSGTTSRPKGVLTSHRALVRTGVIGMVGRLHLQMDDVVWSPAPMGHIGSFVALIGCFATGAEFVSAPYFEPDATITLLNDERVTIAYAGFPAFYYDISRRLRETGRELPYLKLVTTSAGPSEIARVRAGIPSALQISVTGSTELSGTICANELTDSPEQRATTAGAPIDGIELSIRADDGRTLADREIGELWVRGYCLLSAYYKDPAPVLTGEPDPGWFRTGDLGTMIDGRFGFRGRLKDMLKVGGENVAAAEVENYLLGHPAIAMAQVVPTPDDRLGEVPVAFVEIADGHTLTEPEVIEFCRLAMAGYKVPRVVRFVSVWPMSATKISKQALRELVAAPV
ncbi:MAG: AMP-dependent synthetase [Pseudonocardiales bacterium]|nr:AMP-dependent synthetase [Pseudonocardiales bacterium]